VVDPADVSVAIAELTTGTGFRIASTADPESPIVVWLTAVIVTVFGDGIAGGGVYNPVAEIVPKALDPPAVPFTCQVTAVLVLFVTVAVNCAVAPSRTCPPPDTVICGCAAGADPPLEHPANTSKHPPAITAVIAPQARFALATKTLATPTSANVRHQEGFLA
jgi:hypothetical protein